MTNTKTLLRMVFAWGIIMGTQLPQTDSLLMPLLVGAMMFFGSHGWED